jgi:hypothetical protein
MHATNNPVPIYLDQNILSHLREGRSAKEELSRMFRKLEENHAVFVYSMTHVDECRDSSQPEAFVQVMEELPVYLMEFQKASDQQATLSLGRARELLLEPADGTHHVRRLMEGLLHVMHFASGWLGDAEAQSIKDEMAAETEGFWATLRHDVDLVLSGTEVYEQAKRTLIAAQDESASVIKNLPFEQAREEWKDGWAKLRERLPASFAQLDEVPDEQAVSFVFSCLDERDRELTQNQFPKGFWSESEMRETGELAGLAFMLFLCGLVRDRRVKRGTNESRIQYFRGQFRDGVHIENAARCAVFVTCDEGAARLARSLYAYAGVKTKVVELKITDSPAQSPRTANS